MPFGRLTHAHRDCQTCSKSVTTLWTLAASARVQWLLFFHVSTEPRFQSQQTMGLLMIQPQTYLQSLFPFPSLPLHTTYKYPQKSKLATSKFLKLHIQKPWTPNIRTLTQQTTSTKNATTLARFSPALIIVGFENLVLSMSVSSEWLARAVVQIWL